MEGAVEKAAKCMQNMKLHNSICKQCLLHINYLQNRKLVSGESAVCH